MSKKLFRPENLYDSSEESEEEEEEQVKLEQPKPAKAKKRNISSFLDVEAQEDDSDDEDDEGDYSKKRKKKKKDIANEQMDAAALEIMRMQDRRRKAAGLEFGRRDWGAAAKEEEEEEEEVAAIAESIEERHRLARKVRTLDDLEQGMMPSYVTDYSAVSQQSLVPSVSDPRFFMVSVPNGKEQEIVLQIMNKCVSMARKGRPSGISAVVASQSKGKIYLESYSEPAVAELIQGVRGVRVYTKRLLPIGDMTTAMSISQDPTKKKKPVKKHDWVRMNRGLYKGDLAMVVSTRDGGLKCVVQLVPRIDTSTEEGKRNYSRQRPPQMFFNATEHVMPDKTFTRQRFPGSTDMCDFYDGSYYLDGYLLKEVTVGTMVSLCGDTNKPTLEELQKFRKTSSKSKKKQYDDVVDGSDEEEENEASKLAGSLLDELSALQSKDLSASVVNGGLIIGDTVEVVEGDLVGLRGTLLSVDGNTVKVKPTNTQVSADNSINEIEFLVSHVKKYIPVGAHVKVTDGRYTGETGIVVALDDSSSTGPNDIPIAVVLTDMTHKEISVRTSQLQESAEVAAGQEKLAGYELHDLVVLSGGTSSNEVGVIVHVGREEFTVVNNHGIVREVRPEEIRGKRNNSSKRAVALDSNGNQIRVGDAVNIIEGPHKGKAATIKQMNRAQLFLYSQTKQEHAGIMVVRSRSCALAGSRGRERMASNAVGNAAPRSSSSFGPSAGRRDDSLSGKTVRITGGQWKGYIGTVADTTSTHVSVELHSRLKKVMVLKERIQVVGDKFGENAANGSSSVAVNPMQGSSTPFLGGGQTPMVGGTTPMYGGATPMHGGTTPMHEGFGGGFTPSHESGGDVWKPGAMDATPRHESEADSSAADNFDPFGSSVGTSDNKTTGGWAESSAGTWTPSGSTPGGNEVSSSDTASVVSDSNQSSATSDTTFTHTRTIDAGTSENAVWFMERVVVEIPPEASGNNTGAVQIGIIKEIHNDQSASLIIKATGEVIKVNNSKEVMLKKPEEHDQVLVTGGADVGIEGELVCIDNTDAILKDSSQEFKIVDLEHLAKIEEI